MFQFRTISALTVLSAICGLTQSAQTGCNTNVISGYESTTSPVTINTSPLDPFESVKISAINQTAWEYWYFDSVSSDGTSGITVTFYKDPSLSFYGLGNLRAQVDAVWSNGTKFSTTLFVNESSIAVCDHETTGLWNTTDEGIDFSFSVTHNLQRATINVSGPEVEGTFHLDSIAPARYPAGELYPSSTASLELAPLIYWNEAIPAGTVHASFTLAGSEFKLDGFGGHDRNYGPFIWDVVAEHWYWTRIIAGPYVAVFWTFTSAIDGQTYTSAFLSENGSEIFATRNGESSEEGYANMTLLYGAKGDVHGAFLDNSTGFAVDFVGAKDSGKSWHFEIDHKNVEFEAPVGANDLYSRFVNVATGGEIGGRLWDGVANSEQNVIVVPEPLP